ncbi:Nuclear AAA ATPase (VCP subfamily) [Handroanthus impetiginosus]|uniref:Nuclear AAA ATPase (VCP subfamily) n=1 Tax=Handroanthus impetiginosus TaxID=429701 RepID=A0A2G9I5F4_9LAMI|nr:Nuclear AAA ATPase (VCP subfamily) [Handroanthus impetiginosus]
MNSKNYDLSSRDPNTGKDIVHAFVLNLGTKIHFLLPGNPMVETSQNNSLAHPKLGAGHIKDSVRVNFPKLGGLSKDFAVLKDIIVSSAAQVTLASLGLRPTKGVLLHGPPGTGKTALARVCAHDAGVTMFPVNGPEIIDQYHGKTEEALHEVFNEASKASPAVVFIDELDAIAPARKEGGDDLSHRVVATLLNLMDGISRTNGVLIIAATNRPDSIDPALRRPGRLDKEIEIGVPSPGQRHEILLSLLSEMNHSLSDKDIENLAMATHGFVGADLATLCKQAALVRLRQYVKSITNQGEVALSCTSETENSSDATDGIVINKTCDLEDTLKITSEDFEKARVRVRPSAMREINLEVPKVGWEDVGGQMEVKMQLMEAVQWPQKHKDSFERIGTRPPRGILLFGPPGCSKTLLARAVASEAGLNFLAVKGPELFSKWVGESEKAVRSLFTKARANAPSIIFVDEIDGLAAIRGQESDGISVGDRVISQLLVELDGLQQRGSVTVVAATNRPDNIDPALLRPGRFDRLIYVGPPNRKDREEIFHVHLRWKPCSSDVCISELALLTEGCTGADIYHICREASMKAVEENFSASEMTMEHLKFGIKQVEPSDVRMYETLSAKFQRIVHSTAKEEDDLRRGPCSDKPSHISFWTRLRSALLFLFRLQG